MGDSEGCAGGLGKGEPSKPLRSADPSTLAETLGPGRVRVFHADFDLTVDFVGQRLLGSVDLHCKRNAAPEDGADWELVLDAAANLEVREIHVDGAALPSSKWCRDDATKSATLGWAVRVKLPAGAAGETVVVRACFETAAPGPDGEGGCQALQWLAPSQTAGKQFPYLFSQCQAILARSMFPCQDTCECKMTYAASVCCPAELNVLMSAIKVAGPEPAPQPEWETPAGCGKDWMRHRFEQKVPIPSYLVAIVCGAVEGRKVGPRSTVWSEKEMVDACAWEFEDTEKFIAAAEELCGPYKWGVYDLLVLPPSFPYGGMENPCLTFVTPTLLAKDRSQVHVVAHEAAHSWSGNLVTNETWEHFWLNEGLTVFTEIRILRNVYGQEHATLHLASELQALTDDVARFGKEHNFTRLIPDLKGGVDPDDAFSTVPYIKGLSLFCYLESLVGGEELFQPFLRAYFERFGGSTVTSEKMRDFYLEYFRAKAPEHPDLAKALEGPIAALDWQHLWHAPGLPAYTPPCDGAPIEEARDLAKRWLAAGDDAAALEKFSSEDIKGWSTMKSIVFLDSLLEGDASLSQGACERMASAYGFLTSNCELRVRFLRACLRAKWSGAVDSAVELATMQGRMKFTRPIYRALKSYDTKLAQETFLKHRGAYHPVCAKMVAQDLGV